MIRRSSKPYQARAARGFTVVELVIVVAIALVVMAMAVPGIRRVTQLYAMRAAVTSVTGAIQSARYNAIFHNCRYQLVFTAASKSYTVANMVPAAGGQTCNAAYSAPGPAIPIQGRGASLGANITLQFLPSGFVQSVPAGAIAMTVSYAGSGIPDKQITVSNYGQITVAP
jgi:prepilin-type N-terminal cleavage/methylation domain-containing protein